MCRGGELARKKETRLCPAKRKICISLELIHEMISIEPNGLSRATGKRLGAVSLTLAGLSPQCREIESFLLALEREETTVHLAMSMVKCNELDPRDLDIFH